jgi:hypothetical protein
MTSSRTYQFRANFTSIVTLAALAHLAWEYFNDGIRSHHFLGDPQFPAMHNAWGVLILPLLAWIASGALEKRGPSRPVVIGFMGALTFGAALAFSFFMGWMTAATALFFSAFLLSLLFPVYRGECILGFVLGMTITFGPFIPTAFAIAFAAVSATVHVALLPTLKRRISTWRESSRLDEVRKAHR